MTRHSPLHVLILALIMACRMLGLFMILPVFAAHAQAIPGGTPTAIGLALGAYGLTQAILQAPFGALSDRIGRKSVVALGLFLFIIGSIVAALSHHMTGIILGRFLQGAGAIGSTILAWVADLTPDQHRSKAMATIGLIIGTSFALAMILGPLIYSHYQLSGIFWATAGLATLSLLLMLTLPTPARLQHLAVTQKRGQWKTLLHNGQLLRLNGSIMILHGLLTAFFVAVPILLTRQLKLSADQQMLMYVIIMVLAFIAIVPFMIFAEKKRHLKEVMLGAIVTLTFVQLLLGIVPKHAILIGLLLWLFFTAFTLLEASLPSLVSKIAPIRYKGTAMGIYSTCQYLGIFIGGSLGGWLLGHLHLIGVFLFCALLGLIWLSFILTLKQPPYLSTKLVPLTPQHPSDSASLTQLEMALNRVPGVAEAAIMPQEKLVYLKIDKQVLQMDELRNVLGTSTLD